MTALPPGVVLAKPSTHIVKIVQGCTWGDGTLSKSVTLFSDEWVDLVQLQSGATVRLAQPIDTVIKFPLPWWPMKYKETVAFNLSGQGKSVITACGGKLKLIMNFVLRPAT